MELFMIYKISPHPSLLKRGKRKGRNNPLGYAKSLINKWDVGIMG